MGKAAGVAAFLPFYYCVESREQQLSSSRVSLTKIRKSSSSPWRPQKFTSFIIFHYFRKQRTCLNSHGLQILSCDLSQNPGCVEFFKCEIYSNFRFHSRRQKSPSGPVISSREEISSRERRNHIIALNKNPLFLFPLFSHVRVSWMPSQTYSSKKSRFFLL